MTRASSNERPAVLVVDGLVKRYPPALDALRGVSLEVRRGEVLALLGANGAGKSTLTKIVCGVEPPTSGTLTFDGRPVVWDGPADAQRAGVAVVHQELPLLPNLTAAENVFLGTGAPAWSLVRHRAQAEAYREVAALLPAAPDAGELVRFMSVGQRQKVAIIRALALQPKLLILDEGTSSVSAEERAELQHLIRDIARRRDIGVVIITHFIADALAGSDRVVVFRDGRIELERVASEVSEQEILGALSPAGHAADEPAALAAPAARSGPPKLVVRDLHNDALGPLDLEVCEGEIVGLYGHPGCGASELLRAIAGLDRCRGSVIWDGAAMPSGAHRRVRRNVVYCSGDRARNLILSWSLQANVQLLTLFSQPALSFPSGERARREAVRVVDEFGVVGTPATTVRQLSGGNQQKIAVARAALRPGVLLLGDDLTRGVDAVGRVRVHEILLGAAQRGATNVIYSTDPDELVAICSRVVLMEHGDVVRELAGDALTPSELEASARARREDRDRSANVKGAS